MFRFLFFFLLLANTPLFPSVGPPALDQCPCVQNVQVTQRTNHSISFTWDAQSPGLQYKLWYVRQEDGATAGYFFTYDGDYTFSGLSSGHYTFYFQTLCGEGASGYIGIEDIIGP